MSLQRNNSKKIEHCELDYHLKSFASFIEFIINDYKMNFSNHKRFIKLIPHELPLRGIFDIKFDSNIIEIRPDTAFKKFDTIFYSNFTKNVYIKDYKNLNRSYKFNKEEFTWDKYYISDFKALNGISLITRNFEVNLKNKDKYFFILRQFLFITESHRNSEYYLTWNLKNLNKYFGNNDKLKKEETLELFKRYELLKVLNSKFKIVFTNCINSYDIWNNIIFKDDLLMTKEESDFEKLF